MQPGASLGGPLGPRKVVSLKKSFLEGMDFDMVVFFFKDCSLGAFLGSLKVFYYSHGFVWYGGDFISLELCSLKSFGADSRMDDFW